MLIPLVKPYNRKHALAHHLSLGPGSPPGCKQRRKPITYELLMKTGRPSKYTHEAVKIALAMYRLGATDQQVADEIGVARSTLSEWKEKNEAFRDTLKQIKAEADALVVKALFQRAIGFHAISTKTWVKDEVVKYGENKGKVVTLNGTETTETQYPPDTAAGIFWLKNRDPENWKDRVEHSLPSDIEKKINDLIEGLTIDVQEPEDEG